MPSQIVQCRGERASLCSSIISRLCCGVFREVLKKTHNLMWNEPDDTLVGHILAETGPPKEKAVQLFPIFHHLSPPTQVSCLLLKLKLIQVLSLKAFYQTERPPAELLKFLHNLFTFVKNSSKSLQEIHECDSFGSASSPWEWTITDLYADEKICGIDHIYNNKNLV